MTQSDPLERLNAMHRKLREIQFNRYRSLLSIHSELRDEYTHWEKQLITSDFCRPGALVGFWGHETHMPAPTVPVLWFGHVLTTLSYDDVPPRIDGLAVNGAARVLLEGGHDIRLVPLGFIAFLAIPMLDGRWHIAVKPEFETLFTNEPSFGSLPAWAFHSVDPESDFQDPALSSLKHLQTIHGREALADARRVKAIMRDLAPDPPWCASVMAQAVELGILERLLNQSVDYPLIRPVLIAKLHENGPSEERAQWAVDRLAVVAGKYTARELFWDWEDPIIGWKIEDEGDFWAFRKQPQKAQTAAESITDCATAYVIPLGNCERAYPDRWPVDVPTPKVVDPLSTQEDLRDFVVVRVRDHTHRLLFSYLFEGEAAAFAAIRSLRAFHSNRHKLLARARSGSRVAELLPDGPFSEELAGCAKDGLALAAYAEEEIHALHEPDLARRNEAISLAKEETPSWDERISQAQGNEGWRLPLFCRDENEWRKLASEADLDESDYAVMFIAEHDRESLMAWLSEKLALYRYHPSELPVVIAYDDGYIAECAAKFYEPGFRAGHWVERVEMVYNSASPFRTWQGGTLWDLQRSINLLERRLPRPADLRAEREIWEKELRDAGTWGEYNLQEHPTVEDWIRTKAIKRFLDRTECLTESVGAYFARCTPKLRGALESFS